MANTKSKQYTLLPGIHIEIYTLRFLWSKKTIFHLLATINYKKQNTEGSISNLGRGKFKAASNSTIKKCNLLENCSKCLVFPDKHYP